MHFSKKEHFQCDYTNEHILVQKFVCPLYLHGIILLLWISGVNPFRFIERQIALNEAQ